MRESNIRSILSDLHYISYLDIIEDSAISHSPMFCRKGMRPYDRFFFVDKGHITIRSLLQSPGRSGFEYGEEVHAGPGQIIYIPYDSEYYSTWIDNEQTHHYRVNFILRNRNNEICPVFNNIRNLDGISGENYRKLFVEIADTWNCAAPGYQLKCQSLFMNLLYLFSLNSIDKYLNHNFSVISKGVLYLENNYLDDITSDTLSRMCNISPSWFRKLFYEYAGMSPVKYRNMLRVKKAAELLSGGEYNITEAASFVNCSDLPYFNRLFNQVFGVSPRAYVKDLRAAAYPTGSSFSSPP